MMKYLIITIFLTFNFVYCQNNQIDYNNFNGEKANIIISKKYSFARLYDYKLNSKDFDSLIVKLYDINISENILAKKYSEKLSFNKTDSIIFSISLNSKLDIDVHNKRYSFINFSLKENDNLTKSKVMIFVKENETWQENSVVTKELDILKRIMENSTVSMLYAFYSNSNNKNYPEISSLKKLVKNGDLLDTEKLARVLSDNRQLLSKYIDN